MKVLYASDLHGEIHLYHQLLDLAKVSEVDLIALGGDLLPTLRGNGRYEEMLLHQKNLIVEFLHPFFTQCLETRLVKQIFTIAGNWDVGYPYIFFQPKDEVIDLNQKIYSLENGYEFVGYPFVPPTPFRPKEYEKMDDPDAPWPPQKNPSYVLSPDQTRLIPVDPYFFLRSSGTIQEDLGDLPKPQNAHKAVYIMHSPPLGTSLDLIKGGTHVGSRAIRAFIEERQPLLTLHGHIHESPEISGAYWERIGETISMNPGQSPGKSSRLAKLCAVTFALEDPGTTLTHTWLG